MAKQYKKYTLVQKQKYWNDKLDYLFSVKQGKNGRLHTKKEQQMFLYAQGFCSASKSGRLSKKFNDMEMSQQFGQIAGFKAKSYDIKRFQNAVHKASAIHLKRKSNYGKKKL